MKRLIHDESEKTDEGEERLVDSTSISININLVRGKNMSDGRETRAEAGGWKVS